MVNNKLLRDKRTGANLETKKHASKETKNLEKRFDEMLTRINSLEKSINDLMKLKNTAQEPHEAYTSFNS